MPIKGKFKMLEFDGSFFRFLLVGGSCTGIQYAILIILVRWATIPAIIASSIGFIFSTVVNYFLSRSFTFKSTSPHRSAFPKFISVAFIGLIINTVFMTLLHNFLGAHYLVAQLFTTGIVMITNYLLNRYWSFAPTSITAST